MQIDKCENEIAGGKKGNVHPRWPRTVGLQVLRMITEKRENNAIILVMYIFDISSVQSKLEISNVFIKFLGSLKFHLSFKYTSR